MENVQKVLDCLYCGNKTLMNLVSTYKFEESDEDIWFYSDSNLYSCPVCNKVTYAEKECFSEDCGPWDEDYPYEVIKFPINQIDDRGYLPLAIRKAYEAALKTKNIDDAICLIGVRRVLECICNDKQAKGRSLEAKISSLATLNLIPPTLLEASSITRMIGNKGAHDYEIDIDTSELEQILELVKYILDYMYIIPAKIQKLQKSIARKELASAHK